MIWYGMVWYGMKEGSRLTFVWRLGWAVDGDIKIAQVVFVRNG